MKRCTALALAAAVLTLAPRAHADSSAEDRAAADQLYDDAFKLMKASRWAEACPKLEASQRLDPGIGTSLRLGYCYANQGKTASAWAMFNETEGMARKANDRRADDAAKQAKLLEPKLTRLLVEIAPENGRAGIEIRRDGKALDAAVWSTAVPVDPGEHAIEARKPGKQAWQTTITVDAKPGTTTVRVPALVDAPPAASALPPPPPPPPSSKVPAYAMFGVAGAGVVVGAAFGALALKQASDVSAVCGPGPNCPHPEEQSAATAANTKAWISNAGFIVAAAGVVTGTVLLLVNASPEKQSAVQSALGPSGLTLRF